MDQVFLNFLADLQKSISKIIVFERLVYKNVKNICGVDVSYSGSRAVAAAVLWSCGENRVLDISYSFCIQSFPYIPGFLFIREAPLMVQAVKNLNIKPDIVLVDGHGIAHPRRAGIAVFVGLLLDTPTFGVAKSLLVGKVESFEDSFTLISLDSEALGYAFKPSKGRVFYVSPGYKVMVDDILEMIKLAGGAYPLMLREADRASRKVMNAVGKL